MNDNNVRIKLKDLADENGMELYQLRDTHKFYGNYKKVLNQMIEEEQ